MLRAGVQRLNLSSVLSICRTICFYLDKIREITVANFPRFHAKHSMNEGKPQFRSMKCQFRQPMEQLLPSLKSQAQGM
jgi:hypothetical protein